MSLMTTFVFEFMADLNLSATDGTEMPLETTDTVPHSQRLTIK